MSLDWILCFNQYLCKGIIQFEQLLYDYSYICTRIKIEELKIHHEGFENEDTKLEINYQRFEKEDLKLES